MAKKLQEGYNVGSGEKLSYAFYFFGQNIFFALVALNVHTLFSDAGITAATVAGIIFITKLWDAINDPLIGVLIDKIRFKKGRFLPWIRISLPLIAITSIFLFFLPTSASVGVKIFWAILGYVAWDMSFTFSDVPIYVLPTSMTDNVKERSGILGLGRYLAVVGIMIGSILIPVLQFRLGWFGVGIVFTIIGVATMIPLCFKAKERHIVRQEQGITFKQMGRFLAGNKYLLLFYCAFFFSLVTNFSQTLNIFFARHNLGHQDFASLLGMISIIPLVIVGGFIPLLLKKIDKYHLYFWSLVSVTIMGVIRYFIGYSNMTIFIALTAVSGLLTGANGILCFMFTPDCLEYGTYHTGERAEGVAVSIQTFFNKLTGSITGPIAMLIIGAFGFVAGEGAVQPDSVPKGIWLSMTLLSTIGTALAAILLRFYKLREKDIQIMAQYNNNEISKEEAEAELAEKFGPAAVNQNKMIVTHD